MNTAAVLTRPRTGAFRPLLFGALVSALGDWLDYLALLTLLVYRWHEGPGTLAMLTVCTVAPFILFGPVAGALADRTPAVPTMIGCDLARIACVAGVLAFAGDRPATSAVAGLLICVTAKNCFGAVFAPASQRALRQVVPAERLRSAVSLTVFTSQVAKVAGPAIGGLVIATAGIRAALVADMLSFAASALLLLAIRRPRREEQEREEEEHEQETAGRPAAGLRLVAHDPVLRLTVAAMTATMFCALAFETLAPIALHHIGLSRSQLGLAVAAIGAGAVAGALLFGLLDAAAETLSLTAAAMAGAGLLVVFVGLSDAGRLRIPALAWLPVAFGIGVFSSAIIAQHGYLVQRQAPAHMVGRVAAAAGVAIGFAQLGGPLAGAALATWRGVASVFVGAGLLLALAGAAVAVARPTRRRSRQAGTPPADQQAGTRLADGHAAPIQGRTR